MITRVRVPENREEWLKVRKLGIGGSDIAGILGISPWNTAVDVWLDKTNQAQPAEENEAMWLGTVLEDAVAKRYAEETGTKVFNHRFIEIDSENHLLGNVDRLVGLAVGGMPAHKGIVRTKLGLEVKTSSQDVWDDLPAYYEAQVMTYMSLMPTIESFDVAVFFLGFKKDFKIYNVERDDALIAAIRETAKEFWEKHVLTGIAPDASNEADCRAIWKRFSPGKIVVVGDDIAEKVARIKAYKLEIKEIDSTISELTTEVMSVMEDGEILQHEDGTKLCTWKNNKDSRRTDWKKTVADAGVSKDIIEANTVTMAGARVFRT